MVLMLTSKDIVTIGYFYGNYDLLPWQQQDVAMITILCF